MNNFSFLAEFIDEEIYVITDTQTTSEQKGESKPTVKSNIHIITNEVVLNNPSSELAVLLSKILSAVKLDFSKINLSDTLDDSFQGKAIIFGDISSNEKYKIEQKEGLQILRADFLRAIAASPDLKKALWGALKQLF